MADNTSNIVRVGSRKSQLALIQSEYVIMLLKQKFPAKEFELIKMSTMGDKILDTALSKIGEKSLFTRELENALCDNRVDIVVHSLKDLPTQLPDNLVIGSVLKRDNPCDAVVMHPKYHDKHLTTLPQDSVIGTSSLRRASQLKRRFPHLRFEDVRGNLNTRLHKLDGADKYAALILAAAGLDRMGWQDRITHVLEPEDCMYAVSQGALAVECRSGDEATLRMLHTLTHFETTMAVIAERAFLRKLEGGCSVPVAVVTNIEKNELTMKGGVYSIDGSEAVTNSDKTIFPECDEPDTKKPALAGGSRQFASIVAKDFSQDALQAAEKLGINLAVTILEDGGREILTVTKATMKKEIEKAQAEKIEAAKREKEMKKEMKTTTTGQVAKQMTPKPERKRTASQTSP